MSNYDYHGKLYSGSIHGRDNTLALLPVIIITNYSFLITNYIH